MKSKIILFILSVLFVVGNASANERIYVNSGVTTHIVMPENIKLVDISTPRLSATSVPTTLCASSLFKRAIPLRYAIIRKKNC